MLNVMLTHFGHTVVEARNGREGLQLLPDSDADLVITDIVMPEMDGLEVLMKLRTKDPPIKIIAMSGGGRTSVKYNLDVAKVMGAGKVIPKPFSCAEMLGSINELLDSGNPTKTTHDFARKSPASATVEPSTPGDFPRFYPPFPEISEATSARLLSAPFRAVRSASPH